jgi:hypothetical protein
VEGCDGDHDLGGAGVGPVEPLTVADNLLEAADLVLNPGSNRVAAVPLPSLAPGLDDRLDVPVTL